eukprot:Hpha_TRINITY_DN15547_c2_g11::TRINITY_DN15547_c2_g11_i1::g.108591::m.108591
MASGDEQSPPRKKVDIGALNERLYIQQQKKTKDAERKREQELKSNETRLLITQKKLKKEELEGMVGRIYTSQMAKMQQRRDKNQHELEKQSQVQGKKMTTGDLSEMVQRMYNTEVDRRKTREAILEKKYQPPPPRRKLDREKEKEVNSRLYEETKGKKEQIRDKLYQKYNADDIPPPRKLGKSQQEAMAARLTGK